MDALTLDEFVTVSNNRLGTFDMPCPICGPGRRSPANRRRPVLRVWRGEPAFASYHCVRCGLSGHARGGNATPPDPERLARQRAAIEAQDRDAIAERLRKARYLWSRRRPPEGPPVETYLRKARGYGGTLPASVGHLPPLRPDHHPAMIAAFAWPIEEPEPAMLAVPDSSVRGVHLTLLRPDGLGKAGTGRDKLMIGRSLGAPIVLAPMNDLLGLIVCEGIETGLSLAEATGCGVWAAGSASRMPALADAVPDYTDCVTVAGEADDAGRTGALALADRLRRRGLHVEVRFLGSGEAAA